MPPYLLALTLREHHVLHAIAYAVPAKEIARYLGVSEATVRTHIRHLQEKLDAHGTAAFTRAAVRLEGTFAALRLRSSPGIFVDG